MTNEVSTDKALGSPWDDPNVPVGDAPPRSRWPLVVLSLAWLSWVLFLLFMTLG